MLVTMVWFLGVFAGVPLSGFCVSLTKHPHLQGISQKPSVD
jgi:hypothetical protein